MTKRKRAYRTLYLMKRAEEIERFINENMWDDDFHDEYWRKKADDLWTSVKRHKRRFSKAGQWAYWIRFINEPMQ